MPSDAQVERLALPSLTSVSNPGNPGALWLHGCMLDPLLQLTYIIREMYNYISDDVESWQSPNLPN